MLKKNKRKIIFIIIFLFIFVFLILFAVFKLNKDDKKVNNNKKEDNLKWYVSKGDASLIKFYFSKESGLIVTIKDNEEDIYKESKNYNYINSYKCYLSDCKNYGFNKEKSYVIIKDDGYLIYDYKNNLSKKINLANTNYNSIEFLTYDKKDYGLSVSDSYDKYAFYDLKKEKFTTEFKYKEISLNETACLLNGNFIGIDTNYNYVVNYKNGNIVNTKDVYIGSIGNKNMVYYYEKYDDKIIFYNDKFDLLLEKNNYLKYGVSDKGNLAITDDLISFSIYNKNGLLVKKSKPYKKIYLILDNYIVLKDNDDYLKIVDYDGNVLSKITYLDENKTLDLDVSGVKIIDDKKMVYLVVLDDENEKIVYYYSLENKELYEFKVES